MFSFSPMSITVFRFQKFPAPPFLCFRLMYSCNTPVMLAPFYGRGFNCGGKDLDTGASGSGGRRRRGIW